jgi:dynein heavy chain, axonemal
VCKNKNVFLIVGMGQKLICTPETDKVKLVITQSLRLQLGVLISGHSGVGKTAIVRDLARTLGRHLVCFDCTASTPWGSVARVLSGVAQTGFWACLKQFNLLAPSSLSIISAQLQTLKAALTMRLRSFNFNDTEVRLDPAMAVLATVRPGQVARTELPLTLTALFRPAACAPPHLSLIAAVRLQALGFANFKVLLNYHYAWAIYIDAFLAVLFVYL